MLHKDSIRKNRLTSSVHAKAQDFDVKKCFLTTAFRLIKWWWKMQVLFFPRQRFYYTRSTCSTMPMNGASHLPLTTSGANNITQGSKTGDLSPDEMLLLMRVLLSCCWMDAVIVELTAYNTFAHFLNSYLG